MGLLAAPALCVPWGAVRETGLVSCQMNEGPWSPALPAFGRHVLFREPPKELAEPRLQRGKQPETPRRTLPAQETFQALV